MNAYTVTTHGGLNVTAYSNNPIHQIRSFVTDDWGGGGGIHKKTAVVAGGVHGFKSRYTYEKKGGTISTLSLLSVQYIVTQYSKN